MNYLHCERNSLKMFQLSITLKVSSLIFRNGYNFSCTVFTHNAMGLNFVNDKLVKVNFGFMIDLRISLSYNVIDVMTLLIQNVMIYLFLLYKVYCLSGT